MEAKQVKDLMEAYSSIYVQSEQEVLSEGEGVETQTQFKPLPSSGSTGGKPQQQQRPAQPQRGGRFLPNLLNLFG